MPTYVYECGKCGEEIEVWQSFSDDALRKHPDGCGGKLTKVYQPVGIVLKGPGFYKTDSRNGKKSSATSERSDSSASDSGSSSDSGSAKESKSEKKPDSSGSGPSGSGSSDSGTNKTETKKADTAKPAGSSSKSS
jgi:putative FmdB family regulatory protein